MLSANGVENEPADWPTEYERAGSCDVRMCYSYTMYIYIHIAMYSMTTYVMQFTQECVYRYSTAQYSFGEEEREKLFFSTDVHWHCESSKGLCSVS